MEPLFTSVFPVWNLWLGLSLHTRIQEVLRCGKSGWEGWKGL